MVTKCGDQPNSLSSMFNDNTSVISRMEHQTVCLWII